MAELTEWEERVLRYGPIVKITGWAVQDAQDAVASLTRLGLMTPAGERCKWRRTAAGTKWINENTAW